MQSLFSFYLWRTPHPFCCILSSLGTSFFFFFFLLLGSSNSSCPRHTYVQSSSMTELYTTFSPYRTQQTSVLPPPSQDYARHPSSYSLELQHQPSFDKLLAIARPIMIGTKSSKGRRKPAPGSEHIKHRRTRSGCYTCRQRRVKVGLNLGKTTSIRAFEMLPY